MLNLELSSLNLYIKSIVEIVAFIQTIKKINTPCSFVLHIKSAIFGFNS